MRFAWIALLMICAAGNALAQGWSQPVREVEKEARSAYWGSCFDIRVEAGYSGSAVTPCSFRSIQPGAQSMTEVPAGSVLVIEDVNANCTKHQADALLALNLNNGLFPKNLPLTTRSISNNRETMSSSTLVKIYVPGGRGLYAGMGFYNNATQVASCTIYFSGHMVNVQ